MDKQAYEASVNRVLDKKANGNRSAGVGRLNAAGEFDNIYSRTLDKNLNANARKNRVDVSPEFFPVSYIMKPGRKNGIITNNHLLSVRKAQAENGANLVSSDPTSSAYKAAYGYLMQRGAENHSRYKNDRLNRNLPTRVPMPKEIPAKNRKELEVMGSGVASNAQHGGYGNIG